MIDTKDLKEVATFNHTFNIDSQFVVTYQICSEKFHKFVADDEENNVSFQDSHANLGVFPSNPPLLNSNSNLSKLNKPDT